MNDTAPDDIEILSLPISLKEEAFSLGKGIAEEVHNKVKTYSTFAIERASLRLLGVKGANEEGVPWVNIFIDKCAREGKLSRGALFTLGEVIISNGKTLQEAVEGVATGAIDLGTIFPQDEKKVKELMTSLVSRSIEDLLGMRRKRQEMIDSLTPGEKPLLYVIVASGNIYEDVKQAKSAAMMGADIIAVIRTTAQSLLDYIPYGITTEGFGGTVATQENFALMRKALDEVSLKLGRYIRLVNYCSGLAMPEIATLGALEGLDIMVNDAIYGILFRDINSTRTLTDQEFSRRILSLAGITIVTGEDNLIKTVDAKEMAHTVTASQLINHHLALLSGLPPRLIGMGHAFEMDPSEEDSFLNELAQAWLVRELFPQSPIKYMPPTRFMTGDIFRGMVLNAAFNLIGVMTKQEILLLGMPTEAMHTPYVQDRFLSLENALYFRKAAKSLMGEFRLREDSLMRKRAIEVLNNGVEVLREIKGVGLFEALAQGSFAEIKRPLKGGRGLEGVFAKARDYFNPFLNILPGTIISRGTNYGD